MEDGANLFNFDNTVNAAFSEYINKCETCENCETCKTCEMNKREVAVVCNEYENRERKHYRITHIVDDIPLCFDIVSASMYSAVEKSCKEAALWIEDDKIKKSILNEEYLTSIIIRKWDNNGEY